MGMSIKKALHTFRQEVVTILFFALLGSAAALSSPVAASGPCPVEGGGCTNICIWGWGGCECTSVDCVEGACQYVHCECCTACEGASCAPRIDG